MLTTRTTTITRILTTLLAAHIFLPAGTALILRKLWFLMDVPDNHRREWTVRNRNLWSDLDLFLGVFFMVQVDAFLGEVKREPRVTALRQWCLAQRSLVVLAEYLAEEREGEGKREGSDMHEVATNAPNATTTTTATPAPTEDLGPLQYEYYGRKHTPQQIKLLRPDEWIMREILLRGLDLQKMYTRVFGDGRREQFETPGIGGQRVTWDEQMRLATLRSQVDWMEVVRLDR